MWYDQYYAKIYLDFQLWVFLPSNDGMKAEDSAALLITAICVLWHLPSTSYRAMPLPLLWQAEQLPFPQPKITAATTGNKSSAVAPAALAS